jgi:hypothetical protein
MITKKRVQSLFMLVLVVLPLLPAATPDASAAPPAAGTAGGQSYVLTRVEEAAAEGYTYAAMEAALRDNYEQDKARGMTFDYAWQVGDEEAHYYHKHQYDGKIYEPHDIITEDLKVLYSRPSAFSAEGPLKIPFILGWKGVNKTPVAGNALGMFHVIVFAGDDPSYMYEKPGRIYYLDGDDELRDTFVFDLAGNAYKYINVYVLSGLGTAAKLGRGYCYELQSNTVTAIPNKSNVQVNGSSVAFEAYNIGGSNYFKLRDLAMALKDTGKPFEVSWDGGRNAVTITTKKPYTPAGGELLVSGAVGGRTGTLTTSAIYIDGTEVSLLVYNIGGSNYFKLRDLMRKLDIGVTWDGASATIGIDTSAGYTA